MAGGRLPGLLFILHAAARLAAEQEVENLSGLSPNPEKDIFVVRENRTTCLMAEFAAKFLVPYDVWASNYVDLITEQADIPLSRGAEMKGKCGTNESELEISWLEQAYTLKLFFLKEGHNTSRGQEAFWRLGRIQFAYDTSERTYFKDAVSPGKHTANSHRLSALVTPAGKSYECQAQQTISLISSDHQKSVQLLLSEVRIQPFDITADFVFSEGKAPGEDMFCIPNVLPLPQPLGTSFAQGIWVPPLSQHHLLPPVSCECSLKSLQSLPCLHGFQSLYELSPAVIWSQCMLSLHVGWLL
ncbi:lysosome-associated membrane glycoprotein 5 isoform X2 [Cygnus olor]|uniref:lysosome-associated membrane glycoprotein 5 isoform X2 n=1 Tax=Cygnus olor TaxID=8869 RepID=UPI001ADEB675|nr:lysosome-associated membrane glycoprotein 5 isoform X2 [Cygnus olor]